MKYIGNGAFSNNNIKNIEIPESVELVGINAFSMNHNLAGFSLKKLGSNTKILDRVGFYKTIII